MILLGIAVDGGNVLKEGPIRPISLIKQPGKVKALEEKIFSESHVL